MARSGALLALGAAVVAVLAASACGASGSAADAMPPDGRACTDPNFGCLAGTCGDDPTKADYGTCGGQPITHCDPATGQWVVDYECDAWPIRVRTDLRLDLAVTGSTGTCPATPPTSRLFHADQDQSPQVTADPPIVVTDGSIVTYTRDAMVYVATTDDWGTAGAPVPVTATYELALAWRGGATGTITGTATATYGDVDPCTVALDVTGSWDRAF